MLSVPCCKPPFSLCPGKRDRFFYPTFHITTGAWEQPWTGLEGGIVGANNQQDSEVREENSGQALKKNHREVKVDTLQEELTAGHF